SASTPVANLDVSTQVSNQASGADNASNGLERLPNSSKLFGDSLTSDGFLNSDMFAADFTGGATTTGTPTAMSEPTTSSQVGQIGEGAVNIPLSSSSSDSAPGAQVQDP